MSKTTKQEMKAEIRRLAPFNHNVRLPYGLQTAPPETHKTKDGPSSRVAELVDHAFPALLEVCGGSLEGLRVLDLACSSGGFSVEASRLGADYVLGIDVVARYIEQAKFIKNALQIESVDFRQLDIYDLNKDDVGQFDVTLCLGLLYHLENPVLAMRTVSAVTRRILVVDTTIIDTGNEEMALWHMNLPRPVQTVADRSATTGLWRDRTYVQFSPNSTAVHRLLEFLGFADVQRIEPRVDNRQVSNRQKRYLTGKRATFLARRSTS